MFYNIGANQPTRWFTDTIINTTIELMRNNQVSDDGSFKTRMFYKKIVVVNG